jgi:tetratricopeptide (TPR) repeat protein
MKIIFTILFLIFYSVPLGYPQTAESYSEMGVDKFLKGDYQGAIQDFDKAIQLNPKGGEAYYNRGVAKILSDQKDSGCSDLSRAGESGYAEANEDIENFCTESTKK